MAITRLNNNSITSITALPSGCTSASGLSLGKVLKVSAKEYADSSNTSSSSFVDAFDFTNITPEAQNSKYLIQLMGGYIYCNPDKYMATRISVKENNTGSYSAIQTANSRDWTTYHGDNSSYHTAPHSLSYLYTPTDTSTLTRLDFKVQFASKNTSGSVAFNTSNYASSTLDGGITLSVMEIGA